MILFMAGGLGMGGGSPEQPPVTPDGLIRRKKQPWMVSSYPLSALWLFF